MNKQASSRKFTTKPGKPSNHLPDQETRHALWLITIKTNNQRSRTGSSRSLLAVESRPGGNRRRQRPRRRRRRIGRPRARASAGLAAGGAATAGPCGYFPNPFLDSEQKAGGGGGRRRRGKTAGRRRTRPSNSLAPLLFVHKLK